VLCCCRELRLKVRPRHAWYTILHFCTLLYIIVHYFTLLYIVVQHCSVHVAYQFVLKDYCWLLLPQEGRTPLYIAAQNEHKEVVEILLEAGATVDVADKVRLDD
jgi:hypothetical protein